MVNIVTGGGATAIHEPNAARQGVAAKAAVADAPGAAWAVARYALEMTQNPAAFAESRGAGPARTSVTT